MKCFIFFVFCCSFVLQARAAGEAFYDQTATWICSSVFDSQKEACLAQIRNKRYDPSVIGICSSQIYDSDRLTCLSLIENRHFPIPSETSICRTYLYDSDKIKCLRRASWEPIPEISRPVSNPGNCFVELKITEAMLAIQQKQYREALVILHALKKQIHERHGKDVPN